MTIGLDTRIAVPEEVVFRKLDRDAVVLDVRAGHYFGLDEVATRMWNVLAEGATVGEALAVLEAEYEVATETLRHDLEEFVGELVRHRLIRLEAPEPTTSPGD